MKPTDKNVFRLKLGEHRDPSLPGFLVRVTSTQRHFEIRYTHRGKQERLSIGNAKLELIAQAREHARQLLAANKRGEDPRAIVGRRAGITVAEVGRQFFEWAEETQAFKPATLAERRRIWEKDIAPDLGEIQADSLTRQQIREWGETKAKRAGVSANRAFELLRVVYGWALDSREIIKATPFGRTLKRPYSKEQSRERYLSREELCGLLVALDSIDAGFSDAIRLLLLTGVRRSSVMLARVDEFQGDLWTIPAARMKSGRAHDVPLSAEVRAVVDRQKARIDGLDSPLLFPPRRSDAVLETRKIGSRFVGFLRGKMAEALGRKPEVWTIHDLRRTVATHLEDALKVRREVISAILGHQMGSAQTRIYSRSALLSERREALQDWAWWLESERRRPRKVGGE